MGSIVTFTPEVRQSLREHSDFFVFEISKGSKEIEWEYLEGKSIYQLLYVMYWRLNSIDFLHTTEWKGSI